jgi:hypothetical protein
LVQPRPHSLGFGLLPCKRVWQPRLEGCVGRTPTWGDANGIQTFHNTIHQFGYLLVLCCGFPLLNHKHMEIIHNSQKLFEQLFDLWSFLLLHFKRFIHNQTLLGLLAPLLPWHTQKGNQRIHVST